MKYNFEEKNFNDLNDSLDLNISGIDQISEKSTGDDININNHSFKYFLNDIISYSSITVSELKEKKEKEIPSEILFNPNIQNNICKRKDYILKKFKVKSSKYLIERLNQNDTKIKFYKLNFKYFTQNINYNQNYNWFFFVKLKILLL